MHEMTSVPGPDQQGLSVFALYPMPLTIDAS